MDHIRPPKKAICKLHIQEGPKKTRNKWKIRKKIADYSVRVGRKGEWVVGSERARCGWLGSEGKEKKTRRAGRTGGGSEEQYIGDEVEIGREEGGEESKR